MQTLGVLEEYLEEFNGCVIVVSHDRYFLDRTVNTIFAFEGNGVLRQYPGNYSVYLDYKKAASDSEKTRQKQAIASQAQAVTPTVEKVAAAAKTKKLSYKEKREYEQLEAQIPAMEAEKAALEQQLYENPPSDYGEVTQLSARLGELTATIDASTERWMELAERVE